ncbi:hypothetical protein IC620_00485 [Hazenella sp. IB182357]|uniref:TrbL/VirB6 plasmid conjugal transfer protein n=1 Tax=Polycladospora coralii TaxID=2771432 RepID=A0A926N786_9BACL|nr:hypothetical protein [Polycladospora coralii]MBD1370837.1 hypothetical protein [Polycladospora coralii]MBS7529776.1 hypothetical protein [Polycladospora coralii]
MWRKWGKRIGIISALCILFICNASTVYAEPETESEGYNLITDVLTVFPDEQVKEAESKGYETQFVQYEPSRYNLEIFVEEKSFTDFDGKISDQAYVFMNELNNFIWQGLVTWNFTVIMIVENAFSLDIVDQFADAVEKAVQQLAGFTGSGYGSTGIMGNFLTLMIIIAGAWIAYTGLVQKKAGDALTGMLSSVLILVLGLAFFANVSGVMRYFNDISSGLSQELMGVGIQFQEELTDDENSYPAEVSSLVISDKLYDMMIYEPYLMLQYAKTSEDPLLTTDRIQKILKHKPGSTARDQAVKAEYEGTAGAGPNGMVSTQGVFQRLTLLMLLCVSHLILGLLFFIIAGTMLVYQFLFVLISLFAPFAFLMGLNPAWSSVVTNWFKKFIGFQLIKLIIGVFFSMLLTVSQFLYQMAPPSDTGYVWTISMQLILVVGVIWKRDELFSIMKAPMGKEKKGGGDLNVEVPIQYVTKYTDRITDQIQRFKVRK